MRPCAIILSAVSCAFLLGCGRPDARSVRIAGEAPGAVANWRARIESRIPPAQWREFDAALQELKWKAKEPGTPANGDVTAEAVAKLVAGCTFDEVLRLGYATKVRRLEGIRVELKEAVDANALMIAKDADSAAYLNRYRREQHERLVALDTELVTARQRFIAVGGKLASSGQETAVPPDAAPAVLSRAEALREIDDLIERQRGALVFKFGAWPVRFDLQGSMLPAADQPEFQRRGALAATNRHAVVGVRLKGEWRIYDAPVNLPTFSHSVTANLTAADREAITRKWALLEAETWARTEDKNSQPK